MLKTFGIKRYIKAFNYSISGLCAAFKKEPAFRLELLTFTILIPIAFCLAHDGTQLTLLIGSIFLILIVELINSAFETVIDRIGTERNILSGRAKDIASAAVLMSIINAVLIWILVIFF